MSLLQQALVPHRAAMAMYITTASLLVSGYVSLIYSYRVESSRGNFGETHISQQRTFGFNY